METKKELKVLSKDEQKEVAKDILNRYPKANKVIVASDGQAFIADESDAAAKNHSKVNSYGKELSLTTFTRDELAEASAKTEETVQKTAKEVIALVEAAKTVDEVNALIEGDVRVTVVAAETKMIETLNAAK